jgi:membrane fusion protein (multidrug efflux system)
MSQATLGSDRAIPAPTPIRTQARRTILRFMLMTGGIAVLAVVSVAYWVHGGRYVSVDNAYVRAGKLAVSTDVSGIVAEVKVREGQRVAPGDVLFRLDDGPFRNALEAAKANLAQAVLGGEAMKRDYQRMLRDIDAKQAQVQADQASFDRYAALVKGGGVTRADYDDIRFRLAANKAGVESLIEQGRVQLARLGGNAEIAPAEMPSVREKQAQVDEAQRQLDHTIVRAPFAAIATQVEALQPGMYQAASAAAFGLVSTERVWVEANPKETDLTDVKPGDAAQVTIDSYPGRTWQGRVASIAPNSGAEFSILPAQNASGNWVKVVQRIPVRVEVVRQKGDPELRAGMSAVVDIDTGHVRHLSDLWRH